MIGGYRRRGRLDVIFERLLVMQAFPSPTHSQRTRMNGAPRPISRFAHSPVRKRSGYNLRLVSRLKFGIRDPSRFL